MFLIELTQNEYAQVDDIDSDLNQFNWSIRSTKSSLRKRKLYAQRRLGCTHIFMHRVIAARIIERELTPFEEVDHIDGDGLNNKRNNLKICSHKENTRNRQSLNSNSTTGVMGVSKHYKTSKGWKYRAYIDRDKRIFLGSYDSVEEASNARKNFIESESGIENKVP